MAKQVVFPLQERSKATRERLMSAAISLFVAQGFSAVTSTMIAHEAGVATGTFYIYFKDKTQVFQALGERFLEGFLLLDPARHLRDGKDLRTALESMLRELLDYVALYHMHEADIFSLGRENADIGAIISSLDSRLLSLAREAIHVACPHLRPEAADKTAPLVFLIIESLLTRWPLNDEFPTKEELIHETASCLAAYILYAGESG